MLKLVKGILDFRKKRQPNFKEVFAKLALGQKPDALFIACSDSRMAVNVFASTEPGDLFVIRNVGNMIPKSSEKGISLNDVSEIAAIEFALNSLNVKDIIVCGHSECGAMIALVEGQVPPHSSHLKSWLANGQDALVRLQSTVNIDTKLAKHNQLSQLNVLLQLEHIASYPSVAERIKSGQLGLHGWWFDIGQADVFYFNSELNKFVLIDENHPVIKNRS